MPPEYLASGVYVREIPTGVHTITGVATSITAFVGRTVSGPTDAPTRVTSFTDFERLYGGLSRECPLTYAVRHFFDNGGAGPVVARIVHRDESGLTDESAPITDADIADAALEVHQRGLWLLGQCDALNLICIPPLGPGVDVAPSTWNTVIRYAAARRAFVIVDAPATWTSASAAAKAVDTFIVRDSHAALYFPRVLAPDPLAINTLRSVPYRGTVVWGARTLAGTDAPQSEYKYVPVRRTALFIEESLHRGLQWVAFEPNGEPLWAQIRLSVGTFLDQLWRQGAFQGASPREAYFVKCGTDTTTQADIDHGLVNIEVGFASLKPAEFVILRIQQLATRSPA
jgi:phage tail sheath protein FI